MPTRARFSLALTLPLALALGACAGQESSDPTTVTATVTQGDDTSAAAISSAASEASETTTASSCTGAKDINESAFGRWARLGEIPLESGEAVPFEVSANCYDPSAELSWAILDITGETSGQALLLMRHGDMVAVPAPSVVDNVDDVTRFSPSEIRANLGGTDVTFSVEHGEVTANPAPQGSATLDLQGKNYRGPRGAEQH